MAANNILIGLGNPLMSDDAVGLIVASRIHPRLKGFDLDLSAEAGFDVVDRLIGRRCAVIIDSMITGTCEVGTVARFEVGGQPTTTRTATGHGIGFLDAIRIARACGAQVPERILVYGIEVDNPFEVGEEFSAGLAGRIDAIVDAAVEDIRTAVEGTDCTS